jgi:hypothetical protein
MGAVRQAKAARYHDDFVSGEAASRALLLEALLPHLRRAIVSSKTDSCRRHESGLRLAPNEKWPRGIGRTDERERGIRVAAPTPTNLHPEGLI